MSADSNKNMGTVLGKWSVHVQESAHHSGHPSAADFARDRPGPTSIVPMEVICIICCMMYASPTLTRCADRMFPSLWFLSLNQFLYCRYDTSFLTFLKNMAKDHDTNRGVV